jgi:hypothetical protein
LTELWSKNHFLTTIFKPAAILKRSKIAHILEMELLFHILKLFFAKFRRQTYVDFWIKKVKPIFCKQRFVYKHFFAEIIWAMMPKFGII